MMTEGFIGGLYRQLIFWLGWVFTVGGVIVALYITKEFSWIAWLFVIGGFLALAAFAYQKHRDLHEVDTQHKATVRRLEG